MFHLTYIYDFPDESDDLPVPGAPSSSGVLATGAGQGITMIPPLKWNKTDAVSTHTWNNFRNKANQNTINNSHWKISHFAKISWINL